MIQVGINEPVVLSKADMGGQNNDVLQLSFIEGRVKSLLESMQDNSVKDDSATVITEWPVKLEDNNDEKKEPKDVAEELNSLKKRLIHILSGYVTTDKIKFDSLEGLDIATDEDLIESLKSESKINQMYQNLAKQFIAQFNAIDADRRNQAMRLLLVRQSKAKHFPTFRKRFIENNPFFEPASIPKDASALKFTKYEIKNGYDKGEEISEDLADQASGETTAENPVDVDSILGGR